MANTRLEKIGTIYSRITGLMKCNAMKYAERPLWYDIYEAFPPAIEARYDRPKPNIQLKNIFYEEDIIRAKFHKENGKSLLATNLNDHKLQTQTQLFIDIYKNLKSQGALSEEKIFETAQELFEEKWKENRPQQQRDSFISDNQQYAKSNLVSEFTQAKSSVTSQVNIKDIFKDE
uniref:Small ribosomal subunit protein mS23 n=1 Tax=Corethrella appendiculata TaxID=1370023 RepID=U5EFL6_9DIPT